MQDREQRIVRLKTLDDAVQDEDVEGEHPHILESKTEQRIQTVENDTGDECPVLVFARKDTEEDEKADDNKVEWHGQYDKSLTDFFCQYGDH